MDAQKLAIVVIPIFACLIINAIRGRKSSCKFSVNDMHTEQERNHCAPSIRTTKIALTFPNVSVEGYAPNFLSKFLESHAIMLQGNSGLKPKEGEVTSKPWQWPINYRGQYFSGNQYRIYLLGNPLIWWGNLVFLFLFICLTVYHAIKRQRGYQHSIILQVHWEQLVDTCSLLFCGWCLHYVPFWFMGRILYYHHYFPALMFNSLISGVVLDFLIKAFCSYIPASLLHTFYHATVGLIFSIVGYSFYQYSPLAYGMQGPTSHEANSTLSALRLLDSWEF